MSSEFNDLLQYIRERPEDEIRNIIANFFCERGIMTYVTHGPLENGADLVLCLDKSRDILGRAQLFFFQVKKGNIDTSSWRHSLHSQLYELYDREIDIQPYNSIHLSRRIVLVTSGIVQEQIRQKIYRMNVKHHIPIETFGGYELARYLYDDYNYRKSNAENDIRSRYFLE